MQRSVKDLVEGISNKSLVDPVRISRTVRLTPDGIRVVVDEDVVNEIPEGQSMLVEVHDIADDFSVKTETADLSAEDFLVNDDLETVANATDNGLELRLIF